MEAFTKSEDVLRGRLDDRLGPLWSVSWNTNRYLRRLSDWRSQPNFWLVPLAQDGNLLGRRSGACELRLTLMYAARVPSRTMLSGHELLDHQGCFAPMLRGPGDKECSMNLEICMLNKTYLSDRIALVLHSLSGRRHNGNISVLDGRGDDQRDMLRRWRWIGELYVCKLEEEVSS
jgi:hypothetical protein